MNYDEACNASGGWIQPDGTLFTDATGYRVLWKGHAVKLEGDFAPHFLEAIAVYARGRKNDDGGRQSNASFRQFALTLMRVN